MRKLTVPIIVIALLLGVEAIALRVDDRVPAPLTWDNQFTQDKSVQIAGLPSQVDVVFAGSSVAQANLDPDIFNEASPLFETAYNAGIPSATPRIWREFLLDTVYRQTCPKVVVIAVDIRQFNDNKPGAANQLDRYLNSPGRLEAVGSYDIWQRAEDWLQDKSALFRIRERLREPDKVVAWVWKIGDPVDWRNTNLTDLGRYQSNDHRTYEASQERLDNLATGAFRDFAVGGAETDAIRLMIRDATERGAVPVIVEMPAMNQALSSALPNGAADLAAYSSALAEAAAEANVPFVRLPEFDNQAEFFSDDYHMNLIGIQAVTKRLATEIDQLGLDLGAEVCGVQP